MEKRIWSVTEPWRTPTLRCQRKEYELAKETEEMNREGGENDQLGQILLIGKVIWRLSIDHWN